MLKGYHLRTFGFPVIALLALFANLHSAPALGYGTTTRVSVDSRGNQGVLGGSGTPAISGDGRYVAFSSNSSNLAGSDSSLGQYPDIYVYDRQTGQTSRISDNATGKRAYASGGLSISADGRFVAFLPILSEILGCAKGSQLVVHNRESGENICVSTPPNFLLSTNYSSLSVDGRYIAFDSIASNLVENDTNGERDVFLYDFQTQKTKRVSVDSAGNQPAKSGSNLGSTDPAISADGRYVAFESGAKNLVAGDVDNKDDIFIHDTQTGVTGLISVSSSGIKGNGNSERPSISADGRYVAFDSDANNLVPGRSGNVKDIYVHDLQTHETSRVSVDSTGKLANRFSTDPSISADGRYVTFTTEATNLISGDPHPEGGVFIHDRLMGQTTCVSIDLTGNHCAGAAEALISTDGKYVAFTTGSPDLVVGDTNGIGDVFVHARGVDVTPTPDSADLSVTLSDNPDPIIVNNPLTYTTMVTNNGPAAATGVQLNLTLANGTNFVSAASGCVLSGADVSCPIGDLAMGAQVSRSIVAAPTLVGATNTRASISANQADSNSANNQASAVTTVTAAPGTQVSADLTLILRSPKSVKIGKNVLYTFAVKNKTKVLAPSVIVNIQIPDTVKLLKKPNYCTVTGTQLACDLGRLGKKKTKIFSIKVRSTTKGLITNTASVSSNLVRDTNLANNAITKSTKVR